MKKLLLSIIIVLVLVPAEAQEFIGLTGKSIRETMARDNPGLTPDNSVRNEVYRYLKYYSGDDNETWLIFLDDRDRCNGVRITYGISGYDARVKELNERYESAGVNEWSYRSGWNVITVKLKRDEWFFTVTHVLLQHL
jgi:hypothetical protein